MLMLEGSPRRGIMMTMTALARRRGVALMMKKCCPLACMKIFW